jgi:hypothetical protein
MTEDWNLVWRGFGVAFVGFVSVVLYILGISNLYIGMFGRGAACLTGAALFLVVFMRVLNPYLDTLTARWPDEVSVNGSEEKL